MGLDGRNVIVKNLVGRAFKVYWFQENEKKREKKRAELIIVLSEWTAVFPEGSHCPAKWKAAKFRLNVKMEYLRWYCPNQNWINRIKLQ